MAKQRSNFKVHVLFRSTSSVLTEVWVRRQLRNLYSALISKVPKHFREISVLITNDREIRKLNKQYRKKDKATDVLSFPGNSPALPMSSLGDLVISLDTAKRQALEYGVPLKSEVLRLLIHGFLHLLGYDHERVPKKEALRMQRLEERLMMVLS